MELYFFACFQPFVNKSLKTYGPFQNIILLMAISICQMAKKLSWNFIVFLQTFRFAYFNRIKKYPKAMASFRNFNTPMSLLWKINSLLLPEQWFQLIDYRKVNHSESKLVKCCIGRAVLLSLAEIINHWRRFWKKKIHLLTI